MPAIVDAPVGRREKAKPTSRKHSPGDVIGFAETGQRRCMHAPDA